MIAAYILQKFLSILILLRLNSLYIFTSLPLFFFIFFSKNNGYDLLNYIDLVGVTESYELFYSKIIELLYLITQDKKLTIVYYQFLLLSLAASISFYFKDNKVLTAVIAITSIAVMLAIYNNLRQGTASIFILLGILSFIRDNKKIGILLILISLGFHHSSIFFIFSLFILTVIYNLFFQKKILKRDMYIIQTYSLILIIALLSTYLLVHFLELSKFKSYLGIDNASVNPVRTPHQLKVLTIFLFWLCSELFVKFRRINFQTDFIRFLRQFFLFFVIFLSFFSSLNEIANRILYFYYVIEMGLICLYLERKMINTVVFFLVGYGFAFNVWNIISV